MLKTKESTKNLRTLSIILSLQFYVKIWQQGLCFKGSINSLDTVLVFSKLNKSISSAHSTPQKTLSAPLMTMNIVFITS